MKILLQHVHNKMYFRRMDVWTDNDNAAFDFEHSQKALDFVIKHNIHDVQLLVKFPEPEWDEVVPLEGGALVPAKENS